jgi:hypothetical protein
MRPRAPADRIVHGSRRVHVVSDGRAHVAHVGEDGILPNVRYRLDEARRFVRADE